MHDTTPHCTGLLPVLTYLTTYSTYVVHCDATAIFSVRMYAVSLFHLCMHVCGGVSMCGCGCSVGVYLHVCGCFCVSVCVDSALRLTSSLVQEKLGSKSLDG